MTISDRSQEKSRAKVQLSAVQNPRSTWVEKTLAGMSLREKLGQMLMVSYLGVFTSTSSPDYEELLRQVEENHVGGLIVGTNRGPLGLERSEVYPTAVVTNELQQHAKIPLLVGADFESGTGMRLDEGTSFPSAMAIAATRNPKFAYAAGKITALEARAAGVQWIFAPDADVNDNPDNPIINIRSYGEDPKSVSEYVTQFIRGVEENGAIATAKHFPGHGNVSVDSHLALAVVPGDIAELNSTELVPFHAAFEAGVSSIMPGHLSIPALEPDPNVPATLSKKVLTGVLRGDMKFQGLIVTDAMTMGGVTSLYPPGEAAVRAIDAGADVLLMPPVPDAAIAALDEAVQSGRIPIAQIDDSLRRILRAKEHLGLDKNRLVDVQRLNQHFGLPEYEVQAQEIADRGVTLLRDAPKILPLDATKPLRLLLVSLSSDPDPYPGETIEPELRGRMDSLTVLRADTQYANVRSLTLPSPDRYDVAIAALFVRVTDGKGSVGIPAEQFDFVNRMITAGKPTIVAAFGNPYLIARFPNAATWIAEFSTNSVSQRAVARAIFGQVGIGGKIPVTVPGTVARGDGLSVPANPMILSSATAEVSARLKPAYDLLDRAVVDGAFPGGVLAVGWNDRLAIHPFGKFTRDAKSPAVAADTIYDVASLTKPIVTTTAVMMLAQQHLLDLDAQVIRYLPEWAAASKRDPDPSWRSRVTVRMLLLHDSGLPAHRKFYEQAKDRASLLARVMAEPLVSEPGKRIEYSDLGFILLGEVVSRLTGKSLDLYARQNIFAPFAMSDWMPDSMFNPPAAIRAQIAPTEDDKEYRHRLIQGEVHDENAFAMGGVAGHAGLFSTAADISAFAQMLLNGGAYAHRRFLTRAMIRQFTTRETVGDSSRALGWDVPTHPSSSGQFFSARSYGHMGFTGTSLWIDPERQLFVLLLTNRVNPTRENDKIRQVRPALHDAVFRSLGLGQTPDAAQASEAAR